MIRSTILTVCIVSCFAIAQAQPANVHQSKPATVSKNTAATTSKAKAAKPVDPEIAAMSSMGKIHCPAGVHYFVGYNPCIPPSPWDPPAAKAAH